MLAICLLGILFARWVASSATSDYVAFIGHDVANIVTLILGFIACVTLLVWFYYRSVYALFVPAVVVYVALVALVLSVVVFRIDSTDGNLIPRIRPRWAKRADELLGKPQVQSTAAAVDLRATTPDDFPQFLGPDRHPYLADVKLEPDWTQHAPRELWRKPIGAGLSAFSAVNGFAVTMEQRGPEELVTCYEIKTGELRWAHAIQARHETVLGGIGPRSTPTIHEGKVYALGATGVLRCLNGSDGSLLWSKDLLAIVGSNQAQDESVVAWGRSSSPLIVDNLVVIPAGGPPHGSFVSLIAFEKETGAEVWRAGRTQISFASPVLATILDTRQIVSVNESNITGHNPADGRLLWSFDWPGASNSSASTSQPVFVGGNRFLISKGYGTGAALVQVSRERSGHWSTSTLWQKRNTLKTKFTNVVVREGHAYGLSDGILECVEIETGRTKWKRGRYDHGQILGVGEHLLVLSEAGELLLIPASPERGEPLGRIAALEGQTWNNLCLSGKRLLVRNGEQAACYELTMRE